jgi:hypothetical protein
MHRLLLALGCAIALALKVPVGFLIREPDGKPKEA